ncbi:MAG: glycoside hydrolase family 2 TIM barrel-domain containing protein [Christensenellales bacterium]|jgi:beta-galactosidase
MTFTDRIPLDTGWLFRCTGASGVEKPDFASRGFREVALPHDWQIENRRDPDMEMGGAQGFYPRSEIGWYRREIVSGADWEEKTVYLVIEGCQRFYEVYLDGVRVGGHRYGYVPHVIDLSGTLKPGASQLLAIKVDNASSIGDRWYSGAGLYRECYLLVKDKTHIRPFGIRTEYTLDGSAARLAVSLDTAGEASDVRLTLTAPDGAVFVSENAPIDVENVLLWDMDSPNLYALKVELVENGAVTDTAYETVGFRRAHFDGENGFVLNGVPRKLFGANLHHDGGACFGAAVPEGVWERRLKKLKALGCNAIRCSHNPHAQELYDLCDRLGMVMIDELYDKWHGSALYYDKLFDKEKISDLRMMIARDRNHPSIVLWSVGNEVEIQYSEQYYRDLKELCDAARQLDPSRQVSQALIGFCIPGYNDATPLKARIEAILRYGEIVDVFMGNYMEQYYASLREAGFSKAIIGSEVFTYYRLAENNNTAIEARSPWNDVWDKPYVAGGFIWAGVDYLGESSGYPCKGWTGSALSSAGFEKLRSAYLKSQWQKDVPVLEIGVFDETAYDDRAMPNWSFPLMREGWDAQREGLMVHIGIMTNCDEVVLFGARGFPSRCKVEKDGMAHCHMPYFRGALRVEGYKNGDLVAQKIFYPPDAPTTLSGTFFEETLRSGRNVFHAEFTLLDGFGQIWTKTSPALHVEAEGNAELRGIDGGDFMGDHDAHGDTCPMHLGRAVAYLSGTGKGIVRVRATCGDLTCILEGKVE